MGKDLKGKDLGKGFSQRKDGRYEARATINGVKIDIYDKSLPQLKKDFEMTKAKLLRDEKNIRPNVTVDSWYEEWFIKCKAPQLKTEQSKKAYYRKCKNTYCSVLGQKRMDDISQINIQDATNELIENYKERTVKEALGVLRECFELAVVNHIINVNPCVSINIANKNVQEERRVLTHEEQKMFLAEAESSYYSEAYKILLSTGMRIGEFSGLWWEDINWDKEYIKINRSMQTAYLDGKKIEELTTPKTANSYRMIPFFNETKTLLKAWKQKQDMIKKKMGNRWRANPELGNLVFTSTVGSPITRYVLVHDIKRIEQNIYLKEIQNALLENRQPVEFEHIYPHAFRHTFATRCFEKKLDPLFVQSIMGHANYSTTLSYTHLLEEEKLREMNKVTGNFLDTSCVK